LKPLIPNDKSVNPNIGGFRKITPANGFDTGNPDNAMQNNYAWSMAEMGDYIYVGTARNIAFSVFNSGLFGNIPIPPSLIPEHADNSGEIWRYKKNGGMDWQRVYKAPPEPMNIGFRYMILYKDALYAGALTPLSPNLLIVKSVDGLNWYPLNSGIEGYSTRIMVIHQERLYMGALPLLGAGPSRLYVSTDPEKGWEEVDLSGESGRNPRGNIDILLSFNDHLYVGTALASGFELWRTNDSLPTTNEWKLVVDQGAGDARNEHPWSVGVFQERIYLGTAIEVAVHSLNPDQSLVPPKGFDLIRIDQNGHWELVVGSPPVVPTDPVTGVRGLPLSGYESGFNDLTNGYCWQIQSFGPELYLGTWSWNDLIPAFIPVIPEYIAQLLSLENSGSTSSIVAILKTIFNSKLAAKLYQLGHETIGFDLWKTGDGVHWTPVSLNGFNNPYNYGVRMLFMTDNTRQLYLGTANPFQGCEVWFKE
jgi:hypothetical protein